MSPKALWYCMDYACKSDLAVSKLGLKVPETLGICGINSTGRVSALLGDYFLEMVNHNDYFEY